MSASRIDSEKDPCAMESFQSMNCLETNNYDKSKCELAFENYRICKAFWLKVTWERRRVGLKPFLPPQEERNGIKSYYLSTGKIPTTPEG